MFTSLDQALTTLLDDATAPAALRGAEVSFETPIKAYKPNNPTINLFLLEVKENRTLRDPEPIIEFVGGIYTRKLPPVRVDVTYVVTSWSAETGEDKISEEHELLALALAWLSRFPVAPSVLLPGQPFPVTLFTALPDNRLNIGEFWSALGIPPRAAFTLTATVALDLAPAIPAGPPVTTAMTVYQQDNDAATREERIFIGGLVLNSTGKPVAGAWVGLEPTGETALTNRDGRFIFSNVMRGAGYTLRARKTGLGEVVRTEMEIPSLSGEYNLKYP